MEFLDFFRFRFELLFKVLLNEFLSIFLLVFLFLMKFELLLNEGLNEFLSKTLHEVKFVLENDHTEEHFSALKFALSKLELSYLTDFFHDWFDFVLEFFIEGNQLQSSIYWIRAFSLGQLIILSLVICVDQVINFGDFICCCYFGSISLVVDDDLLSIEKWKTKGLILSEMVLFFIVLFAEHSFYCFINMFNFLDYYKLCKLNKCGKSVYVVQQYLDM